MQSLLKHETKDTNLHALELSHHELGHAGEEPRTTYLIDCHRCGKQFDSAHAAWCRCLVKERSLVCPHCGEANELGLYQIEQEFLARARPLILSLQEKGYRNVGVLKFQVSKGDARPSDNVGTLNINLGAGTLVVGANISTTDITKLTFTGGGTLNVVGNTGSPTASSGDASAPGSSARKAFDDLFK